MDFTTLLTAVDFTTVIAFVTAVFAALIALYVVIKGGKIGTSTVKGG